MLNIKHISKTFQIAIALFLLIINSASCQDIKKTNDNYIVIDRQTNVISTDIKKTKSKTQKEDLHFSKELASKISENLFEKIDKIVISNENRLSPKKDTLNYFIYDFILKDVADIKKTETESIFGLKHIGIYEMPITCNTFLNGDKISCVCRRLYKSDFLKDEEFINTIKADTDTRLKEFNSK
ncbi:MULTISPECIES: hypothetical protein [Flavobacterium]|uniref:Lipoprotein n=1 Tax=Flavobacterium hankyongi TaxID=1176532 RepID=A0ABP8ZKW0_9FLAO|nr:hypothetical protein [Flavobacterium sp. N1846]